MHQTMRPLKLHCKPGNEPATAPAPVTSIATPTPPPPAVNVGGHYRSTGTYVAPHTRTAPNGTATDNLSYRG
jgi:hypothetical protein